MMTRINYTNTYQHLYYLINTFYNKINIIIIIRVVATVGGAGRGRPPLTIFARHNFFQFFFFVPGTMFHNWGSIIGTIYVIYIENDLVRLWIPAGALPLDPRSLALRFVGFTHSACHYYSQLFSTTQIGLATTLIIIIFISLLTTSSLLLSLSALLLS